MLNAQVLKVYEVNDNRMDALSKTKEAQMTNYGNSFGCVQAASVTVFKISSNESFNNLPAPLHELVNANSIDFNAPASLSDDSGIPLTTNSSVSSSDSYRLGRCKFGNELVESDGEASQFDSLDNCSEGGMSAENFNTLKKGPLAPIDPPPEFQDSPENTIKQFCPRNSLRRWTSSQSSFEHLKERVSHETSNIKSTLLSDETIQHSTFREQDNFPKESYNTNNKHLYSSDSILNSHTDNIYDEPNNILSSSLGNSIDAIDESDSVSTACPPPPSVSLAKLKIVCPHFEDHSRYFKAIPSAQDNLTKVGQKFDVYGLPADINNYGLYFGSHRGTFSSQQNENNLQRKYLPSPLCHSFYCHHYQSSAMGCNNRPNSRNSLNSRLSSSHNSLNVSSTNKPDDSIFITQAMSHDALLSREISDFYNVPIDSDIYAFPVDMIKAENSSTKKTTIKKVKCFIESENAALLKSDFESQQSKLGSRHKRKKKSLLELNNEISEDSQTTNVQNGPSSDKNDLSLAWSNSSCLSDEHSQEPFHMTLDEVKQFYQTLYTDKTFIRERLKKNLNLSNETIWSFTKTKEKRDSYTIKTSKTMPKFSSKVGTVNSNGNNNNNVIESLTNGSVTKIKSQTGYFTNNGPEDVDSGSHKVVGNNLSVSNSVIISESKSNVNGEKRSQFTLNLKQKFCSIFRFRRNQNRCRRPICANPSNEVKDNRNFANLRTADEKRKKFQSRALPPLPKKSEQGCNNCNTDEKKVLDTKRPFQFTSSIEKVKDYGWYWGPLSSEAAEKVLSNEPDGSFIVRDSSDDHYIFSLSFKLNNCVRHVRIEQDQGTFSFGSYAKFKSQTITEFIEKAVDHSRSGRYLFFLHRRPEHGPMRVQLTNPVSRFKHVQSLQHMCRFVILKAVIRKDLIQSLPLPRRLLDYLNYKHYYSEQVESDCSHSQISDEGPF